MRYLWIAIERLAEDCLGTILTVSTIVAGALALSVVLPVTLQMSAMQRAATQTAARQLFAVSRGDAFSLFESEHQIGVIADELRGIRQVIDAVPVIVIPYVLHADGSYSGSSPYIFDKAVYDDAEKLDIFHGAALDESPRREVVVGSDFAQGTCKGLGSEISLYGSAYRIVGVLAKTFSFYDQGLFVSRRNAAALLRQTTVTNMRLAIPHYATGFLMTLNSAADLGAVVADVNHNSSVTARDPRPQLRLASATLAIFALVVLGLGLVSLVSGALTIANTMGRQVAERTREIGLRRAVGARRADIFAELLCEAIILGVIGGAGGIVLGASVDAYLDVKAAEIGMAGLFPLGYGVASFCAAVSVVLCACAGTLPALRAASLRPFDALRSES